MACLVVQANLFPFMEKAFESCIRIYYTAALLIIFILSCQVDEEEVEKDRVQ